MCIRDRLNTDYLAKKISPYVFQVKKEDCLSLPSKQYHTKCFWLTSDQEKEYAMAADILLMQVNEWRPETIYRLFSGLQAIISGKKLIFNECFSHYESCLLYTSSNITSEKIILSNGSPCSCAKMILAVLSLPPDHEAMYFTLSPSFPP